MDTNTPLQYRDGKPILPNYLHKYKSYFPPLEDIEKEEEGRQAYLPVLHQQMKEIYKVMEGKFWTDEDVDQDLERDPIDRENVGEKERKLFDHVQPFFAVSDFVVADAVGDILLQRIKSTDVKIVYQFIVMMENIHTMTYAKIIDKAVPDLKEKQKLLNAATTIPTIKRKIEWVKKWLGGENDLHRLQDESVIGIMELVTSHNNMLQALHPGEDIEKYKSEYIKGLEKKLEHNKPALDNIIITLAIMEGIFFSGSFAIIFWFAQKGLFPGASKGNEKISEDERLHVENACLVHSLIKYKVSQKLLHQMLKEAVEIESDHMRYAMPKGLGGMNAELMIRHVKYKADELCQMLGYDTIYGVKKSDTFDFMIKREIPRNSDFFKSQEAGYKKHGLNETASDRQIIFDESSSESEE